MNHLKYIASRLILCLLIAIFFIGCREKQSPKRILVPDADNGQSIRVEDSTQRSPKYIASSPVNAVISRQSPLDISTLIRTEDVEQLFAQQQLRVDTLAGQIPSADYNGLRIVPEDNVNSSYGLGLQVWKLTDADAATKRLKALESQYLGVQPLPTNFQKAGRDGFISERGDIRNYLFVTEPSAIIGISCEKSLCTNWSDLFELAKVVQSRL